MSGTRRGDDEIEGAGGVHDGLDQGGVMSDRPSVVPVAQIDPKFEKWRRIRLPLIGGSVLVVALVSFLLIRSCVVARNIRAELLRAEVLTCADTYEGYGQALDVMTKLYQDHSDEPAVAGRYAWQQLLTGLRVGPAETYVQEAKRVVAASDPGDQDPYLVAARAGLKMVEGDAAGAEELARASRLASPNCRECVYAHALTLIALGRQADAAPLLDAARQGVPPFIPALDTLADVLRQTRRFDEAQSALGVLTQLSAGHSGAVIEGVLLDMDRASGDAAAETKIAASVEQRLGGVPPAAFKGPRAALRSLAEGRLLLLKGDPSAALEELAAAAKEFPHDAGVAAWRATALRAASRPTEAIEAIAAFPDGPATPPDLMLVRAETLLDLHRTTDAESSVNALVAAKVRGASRLEGRRLLLAGETGKAVTPLTNALAEGDASALLLLAEAYETLGKARDARKLLDEARVDPPLKSCASGLSFYIRGSMEKAADAFAEASKAGERCGSSFAGRLLVGTGSDAQLTEGLLKVLAVREDLRDRVSLARLKFRLLGADEAIAELDHVRELAPQGAVLLTELANAYAEIGRPDGVSEIAREVIERSGGNPRVVAAAARLVRQSGRLDEAEQLIAEPFKRSPSSIPLTIEQGAILLAQKRYVQAEKLVGPAVVPGLHYADGACLLGEIQERRGFLRDAQIELAKSLARALPGTGAVKAAPAQACLARLYIQAGVPSLGKAEAKVNEMRRAGVIWAEVPTIAGLIAERQREPDTAEEQYRKALGLDVAHRPAWDALAALDVLTPEDVTTFQRLWPGQQPGQRD
jgi:predicted Zn-dependent protease